MCSSWRLASLFLVLLSFCLSAASVDAAGFLDFLFHPCAYNPQAISELNSSLASAIVGQSPAVQSTLQLLSEHMAAVAAGGTSSKALVLSFHGLTGTGKTLLATSIGRLLFESFPSPSLSSAASSPSPHVHHFHGMHYDDARFVQDYIGELRSSITDSLSRCPLSLFIVEEIHFMQPEVLQHLLPLFSYHAMHDSVSLTQAIYIFTSNIGGEAVQKAAFDAERQAVARQDIAYPLLQRVITSSFAAQRQLSLLVEHAVVSRYVAFFPLFKRHVRQCAAIDLEARRRQLVQEGAVHDLHWDDAVLRWVSEQLSYVGPVSITGCKGVSDLITTGIVGQLRSRNRLEEAGWWRLRHWTLHDFTVVVHVKPRQIDSGDAEAAGEQQHEAEEGLAAAEVIELELQKVDAAADARTGMKEVQAAVRRVLSGAAAAGSEAGMPPVAHPMRTRRQAVAEAEAARLRTPAPAAEATAASSAGSKLPSKAQRGTEL